VNIKFSVCAIVLSVIANMGFAADVAGEGDVVVVDLQAAVLQSTEAKKKIEKLNATLAKDESDLIALRDNIKKMDDRYKRDSAVMSDDEKRKLEKEREDKIGDLNFEAKKFQKKKGEAQQELLRAMLPKVEKAVTSLMEEKKYAIIIRKEAILLAEPHLDVTKEVYEKMNALGK